MIEFISVEEVRLFLKEWEEHHTLSRNILAHFDLELENMNVEHEVNNEQSKTKE